MARLAYQDFDLAIDSTADGAHRARVLASPVGESTAWTRFTVPFTDLELEIFLLKVGGRKRWTRSAAAARTSLVTDWGGKLFAAVFTGELLTLLESALTATALTTTGTGLRIRLHLSDSPELADLPWEYLYDTSRRRFLCLSERTPLIRYLPLPEPIRPLPVDGPVRILTVIANPDIGQPLLDVDREWSNLQTALALPLSAGLITVDRLPTPSLPDLHRALGKSDYHVLHFIGHGRFNESAGHGELLFEDAQSRETPVSAHRLATVLHDHTSLRLAVLNACEGGRTGLTDPFAGTAQTLIQQGIPAVVAMQFEISDPAAIAFSEGFYDAVAHEAPVDAAVATGRTRVFTTNEVEWGTPVLYTRASDTDLFGKGRRSERDHEAQRTIPGLPEAPAAPTSEQTALASIETHQATYVTTAHEKAPPPTSSTKPPRTETPGPASFNPQRWQRHLPRRPFRIGRIVSWSHEGKLETTPRDVGGAVAVAAGLVSNVALLADGTVRTWYRNESRLQPSRLKDVVAITASGLQFAALHGNGRVTMEGLRSKPPKISDAVAVECGDDHFLVLHNDGRVSAFGQNLQGQCEVPAGLRDVVAIRAGNCSSAALLADGRIMYWGLPLLAIVPSRLGDITDFRIGYSHLLVLSAKGALRYYGPGHLDPITSRRGRVIATDHFHSIAILDDDTVRTWGTKSAAIGIPATDARTLAIDAGYSSYIALIDP